MRSALFGASLLAVLVSVWAADAYDDSDHPYQVQNPRMAGFLEGDIFRMPSASAQSTPDGVPAAPVAFSASKISETEVLLSWAPSPRDDPASVNYTIQRMNGSSSFEFLVNTTDTRYTDVNLTAGTFKYRVAAANATGTSDYTAEQSVTLVATNTPEQQRPHQPEGVKAIPISRDSILVAWEAPPGGAPPVTGYKIEAKEPNERDYAVIANNAQGLEYLHILSGSSRVYEYKVTAVNSNGQSDSARTGSVEAEGTTAPAHLVATAVSPTSIRLTWYAPTNTVVDITGYIIEEVFSSGATQVIAETDTLDTQFTVTGLETGKEHTFAVSAKLLNAGPTDLSDEASATPESDSRASPASARVPGPPGDLEVVANSTYVDLEWTAPTNTGSSGITGYVIEFRTGGAGTFTALPQQAASPTTFEHTGLDPATRYTYRVSAVNSAGQGPPSESVTVTTAHEASQTPAAVPAPTIIRVPQPPQGLAADNAQSGRIMVSWTAPSNDGGSAVTGYSLEVRKNNGPYTVVYEGNQTSYTHTGFDTGATYVYRVAAINEQGSSRTSSTVAVNIPPPAPEPDPAPDPVPEPQPDPAPAPAPDPDPAPAPAPEPEPEPVDPTGVIPNFPDPDRDPQYYLDRYANEPAYKEWFDSNSQGFTIYEVLGIQPPEPDPRTRIPGFPDPDRSPQYYIDRYNNEPAYKEWFDKNFPDHTIYEIVNATPPAECEPGTTMVDGKCQAEETSERGGGCLVATAAFGSELAPQVQLLREIRDDTLLSTASGASFMTGFNTVYYAFSPTVADWQRENPAFRDAVRISITPMILSLNIMALADSEADVMALGISVIALNLAMYIAAPAFVALKIKRRL